MNGIYKNLRRLLRSSRRPARRPASSCQLRVESLEQRCVPAAVHTFVVTTTAYTTDISHLRFDSHGHAYNSNGSPVSLFEALAAIDAVTTTGHPAYPGSSEIDFDLPGSGVHIFAMPAGAAEPRQLISQDNVTINGYSQPGSSANTSTGGNENARIDVQLNFRLGVTGSDTVIRGLSVRGIDLGSGHNNEVLGNFIGVTPGGATMGADLAGITIGAAATAGVHANNDSVGTPAAADRNVIAGHIGASGNGMWIGDGSQTNSVENNLIGTSPTGSALGNAGAGVYFDATANTNNVISGNIIACNQGAGIQMAGGAQDSFTGNAIFANASGIMLAPTANNGIAAPVLTAWTPTTVTGHLTKFTAGATYRLDFYNNVQTDAAGHYEGQTLWGTYNVVPDKNGNFTVNVPQPSSGGLTATVTDPQHDTSPFSAPTDFNLTSYSGPTLQFVEGNAATNFLAGTITHDGNPNANVKQLEAIVSWGDGTSTVLTSQSSTAGQIVPGPYNVFQLRGNHTYAEAGTYHITATVIDTATHAENSGINTLVHVADAPLTLTTSAISATEQAAFQGSVATFTDGNPEATASQFSATINWGDGTTSTGTIAAAGNGFGVSGSHTYTVPGTYTVTVAVTDVGGAKASGTLTATVADAPLTPQSATVAPTEGTSFTGAIGSFTDPGAGASPSYTAVITWGDGHTSTASTAAGTIVAGASGQGSAAGTSASAPVFYVMGTNYYETAGSYPVTIVVTDAGGATTTINSTANVADAPLTPESTTIAPTEGATFTGAVGSFTDPGGWSSANYTAVITWGDGHTTTASTAAGTIVQPGYTGSTAVAPGPQPAAQFSILGTNTYATAGTYPISIVVTDSGGATTTINSTADVADAPLTAIAGTVNATAGTPFTGPLASFTDAAGPAPVGNYTATINWGDSTTPTTGVISVQGNTFTVTGTHTYATAGTMPITVLIADAGGASTTLTLQALVGPAGS